MGSPDAVVATEMETPPGPQCDCHITELRGHVTLRLGRPVIEFTAALHPPPPPSPLHASVRCGQCIGESRADIEARRPGLCLVILGGGGSKWPPGILDFPQEKNEIYQRGPNLEVDFRYTNFFLASDPPPPV